MAAYPEVVIQIHKLGLHPLLHQTQTEGRNVDIMLQWSHDLAQQSTDSSQVVIFICQQVLENIS